MPVHVRKQKGGSSIGPHHWPEDGSVCEVPDELAADLFRMDPDEYSRADPEGPESPEGDGGESGDEDGDGDGDPDDGGDDGGEEKPKPTRRRKAQPDA